MSKELKAFLQQKNQPSAKWHFSVQKRKDSLQLSFLVLASNTITNYYWRAQENGGSGFEDNPWDHNFGAG